MLLIYSTQSTTRLQYICKFIFDEVLVTSYTITTDEQNFIAYDGPKINYSNNLHDKIFTLKPHTLLFEKDIRKQQIDCFKNEEKTFFFKCENGDYHFDILAASFYLITRYEEYLPHTKDMYGRYAHENSLAHTENFLQFPQVNDWIFQFKQKLIEHFPTILFSPKSFSFTPTYDIDIAWSYKNKGLMRNLGGFLKKPSLSRLQTLGGLKVDPFDSYDFLIDLHKEYDLKPIYFFLVAAKNSIYDKNILPHKKPLQLLIKQHAAKYKIGLHPSWQSYSKDETLIKEKLTLEKISNTNINTSRQHYIKFTLPQTYSALINAGIVDDYSMGYGSINGFRASTASSFLWYDLSSEKITTLRIHPFCFMDANCFYEQKLTTTASYNEMIHYYTVCNKINGEFISIFHNNFFGTDPQFAGWRKLYSKFISQLPQ